MQVTVVLVKLLLQFSNQWKNLNFVCWLHVSFRRENNNVPTQHKLGECCGNSCLPKKLICGWFANFKDKAPKYDSCSRKHKKKCTKSLWKTVNRSCVRYLKLQRCQIAGNLLFCLNVYLWYGFVRNGGLVCSLLTTACR